MVDMSPDFRPVRVLAWIITVSDYSKVVVKRDGYPDGRLGNIN